MMKIKNIENLQKGKSRRNRRRYKGLNEAANDSSDAYLKEKKKKRKWVRKKEY